MDLEFWKTHTEVKLNFKKWWQFWIKKWEIK